MSIETIYVFALVCFLCATRYYGLNFVCWMGFLILIRIKLYKKTDWQLILYTNYNISKNTVKTLYFFFEKLALVGLLKVMGKKTYL